MAISRELAVIITAKNLASGAIAGITAWSLTDEGGQPREISLESVRALRPLVAVPLAAWCRALLAGVVTSIYTGVGQKLDPDRAKPQH